MRRVPDCAEEDEIVTMRPHPASTMSGTAAWRQWKVPERLTAIMRSHGLGSDVEEVLETLDAGAGHEDLDPARASCRTPSSAASTANAIADVDGHPERGRNRRPGSPWPPRAAVSRDDVEHGDLVPLPRQVPADGPPHARAAPGDHRHAAHVRPPVALPACTRRASQEEWGPAAPPRSSSRRPRCAPARAAAVAPAGTRSCR